MNTRLRRATREAARLARRVPDALGARWTGWRADHEIAAALDRPAREASGARPRLLILSFSPVAGDARVLKQVVEFRDAYEVTTCGYGPAPDGVARHVQIPDTAAHNVLDDLYIRRRWYRAQYWALPSVRWAWKTLQPRRGAFDVVLANDVEAVGLALRLAPTCGVHADLHEYSPRLHEDWQGWREKVGPYVEWQCRAYVARASSWTTVSEGLAREYEKQFGFHAQLVTNAAPLADHRPGPVGHPIRLVHSGAALSNRRLDLLVAAATQTTSDVVLDLYLTPNEPALVAQLREAAASSGRVRVLDPVPYTQLVARLSQYDIGVHFLAPSNFNNRWALPNKLFDYVQARLGVLVGPSPELATYVERYSLGRVGSGFAQEDIVECLDGLDVEDVRRWKNASDAAAPQLSATRQVAVWRAAVDALAGGTEGHVS